MKNEVIAINSVKNIDILLKIYSAIISELFSIRHNTTTHVITYIDIDFGY